MEPLASIAFSLGVVGYSAAATLFFVDLARNDGAPQLVRVAPWLLASGALSHLAHLVISSLLLNICPVESVQFGLSFSALIATVVFLFIRPRFKFNALGAVVAPASLTFLIGAQFVGQNQLSSDIPRPLLIAHVASNLMGLALFLLAGAVSVFYLVSERRLKAHRVGGVLHKLPPLQALDRTEHRLLLAGFPLLTLGLVSGAIFSGDPLSDASSAQVLRSALSYGTWVIVALVLLLRGIGGWSGRRAAYGTVAGATCILLVILLYVVKPSLGGSL